ncbi:MAG: hypothetical protein HY282_13880 [Nitrospirae bacterium]|nr:hypothetical protein [Candidatus Manganitrophaceae bacterium]
MEKDASLQGKLVVFVVGQTDLNLESTSVFESKTLKHSPAYPDVIPKQKIIKLEKSNFLGRDVTFLVKAYLPDIVIVEATVQLENLLSEHLSPLKKEILQECRKYLVRYECLPHFDEEYNIYCVSSYQGDPELYLTLHGERIAHILKNERIQLDEAEIQNTLQGGLKYAKDDLTLVDWDGAFMFDPNGDFESNIELFEIANVQLLKSRILDDQLDDRLKQTIVLLKQTQRTLFRSKEIRASLKEIIQIRTQSILESDAIDHNIKLIGDWYSARVYSQISKKFHLDNWSRGISQKLDVLEDVYTMAAEQFSVSFSTTLEFILIGGWFILLVGWFGIFLLDLFLRK